MDMSPDVFGQDPLQQMVGQQMQQGVQPGGDQQQLLTMLMALAQREQQGQAQGWSGPQVGPAPAPGATMDPASARTVANTAGYAGNLRPTDVPMQKLAPVMPVKDAMAADEQQRLRGQNIPGLGNAGQAMDLNAVIGKLPKELQDAIYQSSYPSLKLHTAADEKAAQRKEAQRTAAENNALANIGTFYNKKTGKPASEDFIDSAPTLEELRANYIPLKSADQRKNLEAINDLDNQIDNYASLVNRLGLPAKPGMGERVASGLDLKMRRAAGDPTVRELDAAKAQITAIARGFGGDSRVSDKEMQLLDKAVLSDWDNVESANAAVKTLQKFRDNKAKTLPIPGLQRKYEGGQQPQQAGGATATPTSIPQGRVPMINPQGNAVTLPAEQADAALKAGYKPYQQ